MNYNEASAVAELEFGEVDWNKISWGPEGPDVDTSELTQEEARRYQLVATRVWQLTDEEDE